MAEVLEEKAMETSEVVQEVKEADPSDLKVPEPEVTEAEASKANGDHKKEEEVVSESSTPVVEEKAVEAPAEETNGNSTPQAQEQTEEQTANKTEEQTANKTEEQTANKTEEQTANKTEEEKKDDSLGSTVAKHYNEIPHGDKETRKSSRIFHLRNFNNWVKAVIVNEYLGRIKRRKRVSDEINVLDLACGKGGDLLKWQKGNVDHVIMADIASTSIDQCKERYQRIEKEHKGRHSSRDRLFTTELFTTDCTKTLLREKFNKPEIKLDLTSCQFAFHYSFESYAQAEMMVRNACENLRPGGYFVGTTPDAQKIVKRIKSMEGESFGNSVYNIKPDSKDSFPLFGCKYMFHLDGCVDCPEFLVYMPALEKIAAKYNMKLAWTKNFHDFFKDNERDYASLLTKMSALETYPAASAEKPLVGEEDQYKTAAEYIAKNEKQKQVGTLSSDEWEAIGMYLVFAFEKQEPPREPRTSSRSDDRKRHRDTSRDSSRSHRSRDGGKRSSDSTSAKKSKKEESQGAEEYEVMDEIKIDESETPASTTPKETPSTPAAEIPSEETPKDTHTAETPTAETSETPVETPAEVVEEKTEESPAVEAAKESTEETPAVAEESTTAEESIVAETE